MARRKDIHEFSFARARRAHLDISDGLLRIALQTAAMDAEQKRQWMQEQLQGKQYARNARGLIGG